MNDNFFCLSGKFFRPAQEPALGLIFGLALTVGAPATQGASRCRPAEVSRDIDLPPAGQDQVA